MEKEKQVQTNEVAKATEATITAANAAPAIAVYGDYIVLPTLYITREPYISKNQNKRLWSYTVLLKMLCAFAMCVYICMYRLDVNRLFSAAASARKVKPCKCSGTPISFSMVWARSSRNFGIVESGICIFPLFVVVFSKQKQSSAQNVPDARRISGIYLLVSGKDTHTA